MTFQPETLESLSRALRAPIIT